MLPPDELERQRQLRAEYRARVSEWQSFLDSMAARHVERIPLDYPRIPPPPALFTPEELATQAEEEARALETLAEQERWHHFLHDDVRRPTLSEYETQRRLRYIDSVRPEMLARVISQTHHEYGAAEIYHEMIAHYREVFGEVPFSDESIRAAAGLTGPVRGASRASWKQWDIYTFPSWEEALAFLRPRAPGLTSARKPVLVYAGGVLRASEGTRYITHVDEEGAHGWVNIERARLAREIVARAAVIQFELTAKFIRVEAVSLYIHK